MIAQDLQIQILSNHPLKQIQLDLISFIILMTNRLEDILDSAMFCKIIPGAV